MLMAQEQQHPPNSQRPLTENWISIFGFMLAVVFLAGETILIAIDLFQDSTHPYVGILIYLVGPSILVLGLLCVPLGMWLEHRKRKQHRGTEGLPVFDLNNPRHRSNLTIFLAVTMVFLVLSMVGTYNAYYLTESVTFCGVTCHEVMTPEYTAYQESPHARVRCVECHIGPGADWFVKSKLSGAHQVVQVLTNSYELPIDTPIENLRPARDTCEECHWPEKFFESIQKTHIYYGSDEENTPYQLEILLQIGPSATEPDKQGIHWHIGLDHTLEYYASDEDRQEIPWVRVTYEDGTVKEFRSEDAQDFDPASVPEEEIRTMDCIDCHNRPSHRYHSPFRSVHQAMEMGRIDPKIPEVKFVVLEALREEYDTTEEAMNGLEKTIRDEYQDWMEDDTQKQERIENTIAAAQEIYSTNIFPEWKVDWTIYPWNIGHFQFPGCYRCHNDKHKTADGEVISNDCKLCHVIVKQGEGWDEVGSLEYKEQNFYHPRGFGEDWGGGNCHECHGPL